MGVKRQTNPECLDDAFKNKQKIFLSDKPSQCKLVPSAERESKTNLDFFLETSFLLFFFFFMTTERRRAIFSFPFPFKSMTVRIIKFFFFYDVFFFFSSFFFFLNQKPPGQIRNKNLIYLAKNSLTNNLNRFIIERIAVPGSR